MVSKIRINYTVRWAAPAEKYLLIFADFISCGNNCAANRTDAARLLKDFGQGDIAFLNAFKHIRCGENVRTPHGITRVAALPPAAAKLSTNTKYFANCRRQ